MLRVCQKCIACPFKRLVEVTIFSEYHSTKRDLTCVCVCLICRLPHARCRRKSRLTGLLHIWVFVPHPSADNHAGLQLPMIGATMGISYAVLSCANSRKMVVLSTWSSYFAEGKPRSSLSYSANQGASCGRIARPDSKHAVWAEARTYFSSRGVRGIKLNGQLGRSTCR